MISAVSRTALRSQSMPLMRAAAMQQVRNFNIHEYQSKILCDQHGVRIQKWRVGETPEECAAGAAELRKEMKDKEIVIKAQVHAGGRGKGHFVENGYKGGVQFTENVDEVAGICEKMLGNHLVTNQTIPGGVPVRKIMVAESVDITSEKYLAFLMDRAQGGPAAVASRMGGMDLEAVAEDTPEALHVTPIDILEGITDAQATKIAKDLAFEAENVDEAKVMITNLYELFMATDAVQVELNPIAETAKHGVICVDAKLGFDDNALFRQKQVVDFRDPTEEDPREVEADKVGLNYIGLDGNIACLVNGAGLAMATMDIIKLKGGEPANFLDVGGGATEEQVAKAFELLTADPKCEAVLVNIFGGIMKCDVIAQGIVNAAKTVGVKVPLVVRLEGTNVEMGKKIIAESGLAITPAEDLNDAAAKAVAAISN
jgi:succinyl-CoA synthetase beta subunit